MTILKLKSIFYRYTGVFLAHKEELEYVDSDAYWKYFTKMVKHPKNDMSLRNIHGLTIGLWQAKNGFARPASFLRYKRPRKLMRIVSWFVDLFTVIKWDLKSVYGKIVKYKKGKNEKKTK